MLNHYRGTGGYAALYLAIFFGIALLTLVVMLMVSVMGFGQSGGKLAGGVILAAFWVVGFVVMQRFVAIENRRPSLTESNIIGVKSVLYFLGILLSLAVLIAVIIFLVKLIGAVTGGAGGEGAGGGPKGPPQSAQSGEGNEQKKRAIGAMWGMSVTLLLLYIAPFFNLAVLSRFVSPKSEAV